MGKVIMTGGGGAVLAALTAGSKEYDGSEPVSITASDVGAYSTTEVDSKLGTKLDKTAVPVPSDAAPVVASTANKGTSLAYARGDHVHPAQVSVTGSSGSCTGNAATATKLKTAQNLQVNLATTAAKSFDGSAAGTGIGVTGILPIANGGTGNATGKAKSVANALKIGTKTYNGSTVENVSITDLGISFATVAPSTLADDAICFVYDAASSDEEDGDMEVLPLGDSSGSDDMNIVSADDTASPNVVQATIASTDTEAVNQASADKMKTEVSE